MLKKVKKSRKIGSGVVQQMRAVQSESLPIMYSHNGSPHLGIDTQTINDKSTSDELNNIDDGETDAFL